MKLIINNLVIVVVTTIILELCVLNVCADGHHSKYGSNDNRPSQKTKTYAYSSSLANESPEYKRRNNYGTTEDFEIFSDETGSKLIGGGELIKIKENRQCKNKYRGLKQHPRNKQYYYICQQNRIVLARCDKMKIFNDTTKYCISNKNCDSNVFLYNDLKDKYNVSQCLASGTFPIDGKPRYYYTCVYLGSGFIQKICKCPRGTVFHSATGTCMERVNYSTPITRLSKHFDSGERDKPTTSVAQPSKNESSYESQPCDKPESYSSEDSLGYYYKCCLKSDGKYYQVKLKCPPGKSFDSYSEECVSNVNLDYFTEFPEHSITKIIRNKKRNLLKYLPRLLTSHQRRAAKRIELFNIFDDSEETEEESVNPIVNTNFCGCNDVNKCLDNGEDSASYEIQNTKENGKNDKMTQTHPKEINHKSEYESGYASLETQDGSYESCIECISKGNSNENHNCHKNVYTTKAPVTFTKTSTVDVPTTFISRTTQNSICSSSAPLLSTTPMPTSSATTTNLIIPATETTETESEAIVAAHSTPSSENLSTTLFNSSYSRPVDTTVTISAWNDTSKSSTEEPSTSSVLYLPPSISKDESVLTIEVSNNSSDNQNKTLTTNSMAKPIMQTEKIIGDTKPTSAVTKIVASLLKNARILNLKNLYSEELDTSTLLFDSSIKQTTTTEEKSTSISTMASSKQPYTTILPSITNNSLSTEQPNSTTVSTILLESYKSETATPEKQLTSLIPTIASDETAINLMFITQENTAKIPTTTLSETDTIRFTTSSVEPSTAHSTTLAEESILVTPPTFSESYFTTTAALTEANTNKATLDEDTSISMPTMTSSQPLDSSMLLTTASSTTTALDITSKKSFPEETYWTTTTSKPDIQTIINNTRSTTLIGVERETASNVSTEILINPEITPNRDIERDFENYSEINASDFADFDTNIESTNSTFMDNIYNSSSSKMITTSIAAEQEVTPKNSEIASISTEKLTIPEITTSEDIENYSESKISENESVKENYKDGDDLVGNNSETDSDWIVPINSVNSETTMESTNSQIRDGDNDNSSTSSIMITTSIATEQEAISNFTTTQTNRSATISTEILTIPEITTSEDIGRVIENYSESNISENESDTENYKDGDDLVENDSETDINRNVSLNLANSETSMESTNSQISDGVIDSSTSSIMITTSIATEQEAASNRPATKSNRLATISIEKLKIPEITTSEDIERDIENNAENNASENEFGKGNYNFEVSDTTMESTNSPSMNNISNSSSTTIMNMTSITAEQEAASTDATAKRNEISTISTKKLTIPEITTSEDIERDIDSYNESHSSENESDKKNYNVSAIKNSNKTINKTTSLNFTDSETILESTDTLFRNYNINNGFDIKDDNENHSNEDKHRETINGKNNDTGRGIVESRKIGRNIYDSNSQVAANNDDFDETFDFDENLSDSDKKSNNKHNNKLGPDSEITTPRSVNPEKQIDKLNFEFILGEYSDEMDHTSKAKDAATISDNKNKSFSTESENKLPEITESEIIGNSAAQGESYDNDRLKLTRDHNGHDKLAKHSPFAETDSSSWLSIENESRKSQNSDKYNRQIRSKIMPSIDKKSNNINRNNSDNKSLERFNNTSTITDKNKKSHKKLEKSNSDERKIEVPRENDASDDKIGKTKSKQNKSNDKDINYLKSSAYNQTSSKRYRQQKTSQFKNEGISISNETDVPESNDDTHVSAKIDNQPLLATLNNEGIYEFGHYDTNDKEVIYNTLPTTCPCEVELPDDQSELNSNSKGSDDCCCGCITNDTSDSSPTDINL